MVKSFDRVQELRFIQECERTPELQGMVDAFANDAEIEQNPLGWLDLLWWVAVVFGVWGFISYE